MIPTEGLKFAPSLDNPGSDLRCRFVEEKWVDWKGHDVTQASKIPDGDLGAGISAAFTVPVDIFEADNPVRMLTAGLHLLILCNAADGLNAVEDGYREFTRREDLPDIIEDDLPGPLGAGQGIHRRSKDGTEKFHHLVNGLLARCLGRLLAKHVETIPAVHDRLEWGLEGPVFQLQVEILVLGESDLEMGSHSWTLDSERFGDPFPIGEDVSVEDWIIGGAALEILLLLFVVGEFRPSLGATLVVPEELCDGIHCWRWSSPFHSHYYSSYLGTSLRCFGTGW